MSPKELLGRSAKELRKRVDEHYRLLKIAFGSEVDTLNLGGKCILPDCPHKKRLRQTIIEVVDALEETKKAFKSRQLESLRKKLMALLADID